LSISIPYSSNDAVRAELDARLRSCVTQVHLVSARQEVSATRRTECLHLLTTGVAACYRLLEGGRRQISALILPGELCDIDGHISRGSVEGVVALNACTIGEIPRAALFTENGLRPEWSEFAFRTLARGRAIAAEWIVSLGRRSAYEATAHLFCELWTRLDAVGQTSDQSFSFPLTQVDLGDILGLTPVHTNRTLRDLRNAGLVNVNKKRATILDFARLRQVADFDPTYLQTPDAAVSGSDVHGYWDTPSHPRRFSPVSSSAGSILEA
jgi:CRP-like cAMP-binding protein